MLKLILAPVTLVFTAIFMQQAWWIRGLGGAALGAILFIAIPALIEWASARSKRHHLAHRLRPRLPAYQASR